jgi:multicomponent Na+:H+ antiporter subunit B
MVLLTLLAAVTVAIVRQRSLFGVVILSGIYSFLIASVFVVLDAVDVALTEASVGAGVSVVLLLTTLYLIKTTESVSMRTKWIPLLMSGVVAAVLIWGTLSLPPFGTADAPIHKHVAPRYIAESIKETNVPNVVTAVLADYRGFDTLGEVTVIFTAGIGVMLLLLRGRRRQETGERAGKPADEEGSES